MSVLPQILTPVLLWGAFLTPHQGAAPTIDLDIDLSLEDTPVVERVIESTEPEGLNDVDVAEPRLDLDLELDRVSGDTGSPNAAHWYVPVKSASSWPRWPKGLNEANPSHRALMDVMSRGIMPEPSRSFHLDARVSRYQFLGWLGATEDWVRLASVTGRLDNSTVNVRHHYQVRTILELGLVSRGRPLCGDTWVNVGFLSALLDGLERTWGVANLRTTMRLPSGWVPTAENLGLWLRNLAQELARHGSNTARPFKTADLAHLPILLELLEDPAPSLREDAYATLSRLSPEALVTLVAGRRYGFFRDQSSLVTLPEILVHLGQTEGQLAKEQFFDSFRLLLGLNDKALDSRFMKGCIAAFEARADGILPRNLVEGSVTLLVRRKALPELETLLGWGLPVLEALIPEMEQGSVDTYWMERLPYALENGRGVQGGTLASELQLLANNSRLPVRTRANALERLSQLGYTLNGSRLEVIKADAPPAAPPPAVRPGTPPPNDYGDLVRGMASVLGQQRTRVDVAWSTIWRLAFALCLLLTIEALRFLFFLIRLAAPLYRRFCDSSQH